MRYCIDSDNIGLQTHLIVYIFCAQLSISVKHSKYITIHNHRFETEYFGLRMYARNWQHLYSQSMMFSKFLRPKLSTNCSKKSTVYSLLLSIQYQFIFDKLVKNEVNNRVNATEQHP